MKLLFLHNDPFGLIFIIFGFLLSVYIITDFMCNIANKWKRPIIFWWSFPLSIIFLVVIIISSILEYLIVKKPVNYIVSLFGLVLFFLAFLLRIWSKKSLKQFYSSHIQIRNDHKLIETGPYRLMRHPYYLSIIIGSLGFSLIANAYFSTYITLSIMFPLILIRCYKEDKLLLSKFGSQYIEYKKQKSMFIM